MRKPSAHLFCLLTFLSGSYEAHATYSIIAVDGKTRQTGAVVTSCVGANSLSITPGFAPGVGVVIGQARFETLNYFNKELATKKLISGETASQALQFMTRFNDSAEAKSLLVEPPTLESITRLSELGDPLVSERQYAVVTITEAVNFTGGSTLSWSGGVTGRVGSFRYSAQGNILTSKKVVDQAALGFENGTGDLTERLLRAVEGGGLNSEGDSRCTVLGHPSDTVYLKVVNPDGSLHVEAEIQGSPKAVYDLRKQVQSNARQ